MQVMFTEEWFDSTAALSESDFSRAGEFRKKFCQNPKAAGTSLERVHNAKDKNFWSARITRGLRAIIHKDGDSWTLMYAGQHDDAYKWAENHQLQRNQITGALQIVVETTVVEQEFQRRDEKLAGLFDEHKDDYLLSLGVPESWLPTIRLVNTDDLLLEIVDKLPEDVSERLIDLADGKFVTPPKPVPLNQSPFESEDTRRRFVLLDNNDEMLNALDAPLVRWMVFLHPSQSKIVESSFNGAVKVTGSAGTGKTVVAMHRARFLARQGKSVLLTSYVSSLVKNIKQNMSIFCNVNELSKITVSTVHSQAREILVQAGESIKPVQDAELVKLFEEFYWPGCPLDPAALQAEWDNVIQAQAIRSWEQYRDASRRGRGRSLSAKERKQVWKIYECVFEKFRSSNMLDWSSICLRAKELLDAGKVKSRFDSVIVDEVQDLKALELMFLAALAGQGKDNLMVVGDGGQRIYNNKVSFKSLGIDVRGRSHILKINYRTTAQIRNFADKLLSNDVDDLDEETESRTDTKSLLKGPQPTLKSFKNKQTQYQYIVDTIKNITKSQLQLGDIAVFARKTDLVENIQSVLKESGIASKLVTADTDVTLQDSVFIGTMHRAKGLEFKVVFIADVSAEIIPLQFAMQQYKEPQDLKEAIQREKQLLYVSITRARDEVFLTWSGSPSQFLANNQSIKDSDLVKQ